MNVARRAALAAVVITLSVANAMARPIATTDDTNLRNEPGSDKKILTLIPQGTTVEVGKCTNGWCEVSWNGQDGYSIAHNLGVAPRPRPPSAAAQAAPAAVAPASPVRPNAFIHTSTGTKYLGPYNERYITRPDGTIAGTDPDPNVRAYMRREGVGSNCYAFAC
jgi:uncharacterized protein YraI